MRLPLTVSELSAFRGTMRFLVHIAFFGAFLFGLYLVAVWMENRILSYSEKTEELPPLEITEPGEVDAPLERRFAPGLDSFDLAESSKEFPYPTEITSTEGRTIGAVLLSRPSEEHITFRRTMDDQIFTIGTQRLGRSSRYLVDQFEPDFSQEGNLFASPRFPRLLDIDERSFPIACTVMSREGKPLQVLLLERPNSQDITFNRHSDLKAFTIPIARLRPSDQVILRQFPVVPR